MVLIGHIVDQQWYQLAVMFLMYITLFAKGVRRIIICNRRNGHRTYQVST